MSRRSSGGVWSRDPYGSSSYGLDPISQFRRLSEQMDRWFDSFGVGRTGNRMAGANESPMGMNVWAPELETFMRGDQFIVRVDLPGIDKDEVHVEVTDDSLVIHGERQNMHEEEREGYYRSERTYGRFYREVELPEGAQPETAKANYRDGVLEITVQAPPRQVARPRRIEIGTTGESRRERRESSSSGESSTSMPITDRTSGERGAGERRTSEGSASDSTPGEPQGGRSASRVGSERGEAADRGPRGS